MITPDQQAALRALVRRPEYAGLSTAEIAARITAPIEQANPEPQRTVPVTLSEDDLIASLSGPTIAALIDLSSFAQILDAASDPPRAAKWIAALAKAGKIPLADMQALQALMSRVEPDPAWPATVPGPSLLESQVGLGSIGHAEIEEAR